jgi:hypothetical protein
MHIMKRVKNVMVSNKDKPFSGQRGYLDVSTHNLGPNMWAQLSVTESQEKAGIMVTLG